MDIIDRYSLEFVHRRDSDYFAAAESKRKSTEIVFAEQF